MGRLAKLSVLRTLALALATGLASPLFGQAAAPQVKMDGLVFSGVMTIGAKRMFSLYDPSTNIGFWVEEGRTVEGVTIDAYQADTGTLSLSGQGRSMQLGLKTASIAQAAPIPVVPIEATNAQSFNRNKDPETIRKEEEARKMVMGLMQQGAEAREKQRLEREARLQAIRARQAQQQRGN